MAKIDKIQIGETVYNLGVNAENIEGKVPVDLEDYYNKEETDGLLEDKQNKLTAGENITIDENNIISASGGGDEKYYSYNKVVSWGSASALKISYSDYKNECLAKNAILPIRININQDNRSHRRIVVYVYPYYNASKKVEGYSGVATTTGDYGSIDGMQFYVKSTSITPFDKVEDIPSSGDMTINVAVLNGGLSTNNTSSYTPTSSYHPVTKKYADDIVINKQDKLTAGENITIDENNVISASGGSSQKIYEFNLENSEENLAMFNTIYKEYIETGIMPIIKVKDSEFWYENCNSETYYEEGYCGRFIIRTYYGDFDNDYDFQDENRYTIKLSKYEDDEEHENKFSGIDSIIIKRGMRTGFIYKQEHSPMQNRSMALSVEVNDGYEPLYDTSPATKEYVDKHIVDTYDKNYINKMPQKIVDEGFDYYVEEEQEIEYNFDLNGFAINDEGYIESENKEMPNSFAWARVYFDFENASKVTIDYINDGENSWDYGIFSKLDAELMQSPWADSEEVIYKNCSEESSKEVKQLIYDIPSGQHFIDIKYIKDSGGDYGNDSLQFKVKPTALVQVPITKYMATTEYVDNKSSAKQQIFQWSTGFHFDSINEYSMGYTSVGYPVDESSRVYLKDFLINAYNYAKTTNVPTMVVLNIQNNSIMGTIFYDDSGAIGNLVLFGNKNTFWFEYYLTDGLATNVSIRFKEYVSDTFATKDYVNEKIGDIETLLSEV